jgi:hypothetical protein
MGGLIHDDTPLPLSLPFDFIILSILVTIPFSIMIVRDQIFPQQKDKIADI